MIKSRLALVGTLVAAGVVVAVVAFVATELLTRRAPDQARPSEQYCDWLDPVDSTVAAVRAGVAGEAWPKRRPDTRYTLGNLRGAKDLFYRSSLGEEGPPGYEAESRAVVDAIRTAITEGSPRPLEQPAVRRAVRRLRGPVQRTCAVTLAGR
ncbi:MAG: hypothetical protein JWM05_2393 [Acidimicrobiales bacterium]|nr:hypothetical protein [Acidimicrobiales bacterium]